MSRDYRDDCIEALAMSEADLLDRIIDLTIERDSYRAVAVAGIHYSHDVHTENERLELRLAELREAYRRLQEQVRATSGIVPDRLTDRTRAA